MIPVILLILSMVALVVAAPTATTTQNLRITFEDSEGELPVLSLPYATYRAASYEVANDVCAPFRYPQAQGLDH